MKPGLHTTEFWGKSLVQLVLVLNQVFGLGLVISDEAALTIVAGLEAAYSVGRSMAKKPVA